MKQHTLVLHDYFESLEGGGRLSTLLAEALDCDVGYGFAKPEHAFLRDLCAAGRCHDLGLMTQIPLWRQWRLAQAFNRPQPKFAAYEQYVYSGFYTPLAALHQRGRHVLYCHTPPRFIYDQREFYRQQIAAPLRPLLDAFGAYLKPRYEQAVQRMDCILTNSYNVQARIQHYLGVSAEVVYPPCDTARYGWRGQGDYYLSLGRLDPLKRIDRLIEAFRQMPDLRLVIASGGPQAQALRKLAADAPNIEFTGWIDDAQWQDLLGNAIATLYIPKDEDFGMTPVESMAAGKAVIGVAEGGLKESIIDQQAGFLLPADFTQEQLCAAVRQLDKPTAASMREACEQRAKDFDSAVFVQRMRDFLE